MSEPFNVYSQKFNQNHDARGEFSTSASDRGMADPAAVEKLTVGSYQSYAHELAKQITSNKKLTPAQMAGFADKLGAHLQRLRDTTPTEAVGSYTVQAEKAMASYRDAVDNKYPADTQRAFLVMAAIKADKAESMMFQAVGRVPRVDGFHKGVTGPILPHGGHGRTLTPIGGAMSTTITKLRPVSLDQDWNYTAQGALSDEDERQAIDFAHRVGFKNLMTPADREYNALILVGGEHDEPTAYLAKCFVSVEIVKPINPQAPFAEQLRQKAFTYDDRPDAQPFNPYTRKYSADEARDQAGKWTTGGGDGASAQSQHQSTGGIGTSPANPFDRSQEN